MIFNDDDLERLKDYLKTGEGYQGSKKWKALLARLDKSEEVVDAAEGILKYGLNNHTESRLVSRLEAWRKACVSLD